MNCGRMGTHPSGPSVVAATGQSLKDWVQAHPEALGKAVLKRFGTDLPFLFKVGTVMALREHHKMHTRATARRAVRSKQTAPPPVSSRPVLPVV